MGKKINEKMMVSRRVLKKQAVKTIKDPISAGDDVKAKLGGPVKDKMVNKLTDFLVHLYSKYEKADVIERYKSEIKSIIREEIKTVSRQLKEVDDSQVPMTYASLERAKKYSEGIYRKMKERGVQDVDGWVFAKITLAEDYLKSVYGYFDGKDGLDDKPNTPDDVE
jgi:hypothetical protein